VKLFDVGKTGMIALPYSEKIYDDMFSRFDRITACHGQTDRQTDRFAISISRVSVLTRDKNGTVFLTHSVVIIIFCKRHRKWLISLPSAGALSAVSTVGVSHFPNTAVIPV